MNISDICYTELVHRLESPFDLVARVMHQSGLSGRSALRLRADDLDRITAELSDDLRQTLRLRADVYGNGWLFPGRLYQGKVHPRSYKAFQAALDRANPGYPSCPGHRVVVGDLRTHGRKETA